MKIKSGAQTRYQIGYHMVWGVKYHKHLLNKTIKKYLVETVKQVCIAYNYDYYCIGLAPNHVHLFVGASPKIAPAVVANVVKSITAKALFMKFRKSGSSCGAVNSGRMAIMSEPSEKGRPKRLF